MLPTHPKPTAIHVIDRDKLEKQFLKIPSETVFEQPSKLNQAESTQRGAHFYFEQAELEIRFLAPNFVQVDWFPSIAPLPYALVRQDWPEVETRLEGTTVSSEDIQITVGENGSLTFCDATGKTIREEMPPQRKSEGWIHQARLQPEEAIYGLGERCTSLNLRSARETSEKGEPTAEAKQYRMWNYDVAGMYGPGSDPMYLSIPVYVGLNQQGSYLIFYENSFDAYFSFEEMATADFTGGGLRYYLAVGTPPQLLERYTELTGRAPLPPRWALGYHQSRWGYRTEQAVRETVQQFQSLDLPLSAIHLDIDAQVGYRAFTIDPDRFPKLANFTQELQEKGVRFITIINPGVRYSHSRESNLFLEGRVLDAFCKLPDGTTIVAPVWPGWCVFPDFTHPKVRRWWSRQYEYLLDVGVAGFWHDMNEPAAFILWGDRSLPKVTQHYLEGRGGDHREAHNVYGLLQAQAAHESLCGYRPQQRPFIVSRAGWAGLQRYAWTWTGDIQCTWEALRVTPVTLMGLGLSGIPYSGPDIGGFQGNPSAELYLRWFQMATFVPFYRSHCSNNVEYRAPWTYGEPYLSIIRHFLQLRYQLMPYFYTLAWEAAQKGYPLIRPLFWLYPSDSDLWAIEDVFLLGNSLLVCPVVKEGGRSRQVFLPQGYWYNFWDDTLIEGGKQVNLEAPLEKIPLLAKAGSILPMEVENQYILHLYPPRQGTQETLLYSDAGDGDGEGRLDRFCLVREENELELIWEQEGEYAFPYQTVTVQVHGTDLPPTSLERTEIGQAHLKFNLSSNN